MAQDSRVNDSSDFEEKIPLQFVSLERLLTDRLWSPSCSPEDARFGGPYTEAFDAFDPAGETIEQKIDQLLRQLDRREEKIIRLRFGIDERYEHKLDDIAHRVGLSTARIWQIEKSVMRKLSKAVFEFAAQDVMLTKSQQLSISQKMAQQEREPPKKPKDPAKRIATARGQWIKHEDQQLIGQLNGWYGYEKTSFAEVAAARKQTWEELAIQANTLSRRLRRLGLWSDAPLYRLEEKIYWTDV